MPRPRGVLMKGLARPIGWVREAVLEAVDVTSDVLALLREEHALYLELLWVSREQARAIESVLTRTDLETLVVRREDLYFRIEATERSCQSLLSDLDSPSDEVRRAAQAIGTTLQAILEQDQENEQRLRSELGELNLALLS